MTRYLLPLLLAAVVGVASFWGAAAYARHNLQHQQVEAAVGEIIQWIRAQEAAKPQGR